MVNTHFKTILQKLNKIYNSHNTSKAQNVQQHDDDDDDDDDNRFTKPYM
jgi:hypothetical protein